MKGKRMKTDVPCKINNKSNTNSLINLLTILTILLKNVLTILLTILLLLLLLLLCLYLKAFFSFRAFWGRARAETCAAPSSLIFDLLFFNDVSSSSGFPVWGDGRTPARACVYVDICAAWYRTAPSACYALFPPRARLPRLRLITRKRSPENRQICLPATPF